MPKNVLITGVPGVGKTTLIKRLLKDLTPLVVRGFYKENIIENNIKRGVRVVTTELVEQILAHIYIEGPDRIDDFGVNLKGFEDLVLPHLSLTSGVELFVIDEIGKMECLSDKFCKQVEIILDSKIPLLATLTIADIPGVRKIKKRKDIKIIQMTFKNRDSLWKNVLMELG